MGRFERAFVIWPPVWDMNKATLAAPSAIDDLACAFAGRRGDPVDSATKEQHPGVVELSVPAEASYVSLVRLAAAGIAARAKLTVDDIDDLRLAVDEACALILAHARPDSRLDLVFEAEEGCLRATASVMAESDARVDSTGFAWTVLSALASTVEVSNHGGRLRIELTRRRLPSYL